MIRRPILLIIFVLALTTLACGFNFQIPITTIDTGPTVTEEITIPSLDEPNAIADVDIAFGAGELNLSPGAEGDIISGTASYNVNDFKPEVSIKGDKISISQGETEVDGFPAFVDDIKNEWNLTFGDDAMQLRIIAGAYAGEMELGGLSLYNLHITDGAAENEVRFSEPNLVEMDELTYETGASSVALTGLSNANFGQMTFKSGAGDYSLDFTGELLRDADVDISTGFSNLVIVVPEGTSAQLRLEGALSSVEVGDDWEISGGEYFHPGKGPLLNITVDIGAGNLELRTR